jgi:hypothetical protein
LRQAVSGLVGMASVAESWLAVLNFYVASVFISNKISPSGFQKAGWYTFQWPSPRQKHFNGLASMYIHLHFVFIFNLLTNGF